MIHSLRTRNRFRLNVCKYHVIGLSTCIFFHLYWNLNNEKPWILMWPTDKISEIFFSFETSLRFHNCNSSIEICRIRDGMWWDVGIMCHLYSDLFFNWIDCVIWIYKDYFIRANRICFLSWKTSFQLTIKRISIQNLALP